MTKKIKITLSLIVLIFIASVILLYSTLEKSRKSFVEINNLRNSKIELQQEIYSICTVTKTGDLKKQIQINAVENKTHDTLNVYVTDTIKSFIFYSKTTAIDNIQYNDLHSIKISKSGIYHVQINDPQKLNLKIAIQNQSEDNSFFKSIMIYFLSSVVSFFGVIIIIVILIIKSIRNKKKSKKIFLVN